MDDFIQEMVKRGKREILICIFAAMALSVFSGFIAAFTVGQGRGIWELRRGFDEIRMIQRQVALSQPKIEDSKAVGAQVESVFYDSRRVKEDISRELAACGLVVLQINVSEAREDGQGAAKDPLRGQTLQVSATGTLTLEDVDRFMKAISSRPKVWRIDRVAVTPKMSPVKLISALSKYHSQRDYVRTQQLLAQIKDINPHSIPVEVQVSITVLSKAE